MKAIIYLSILICSICFSVSSFSQNQRVTDVECQKGIDSAKVHIEKGNYTYLVFGLNASNSYTFGRLLYKEYGINVIYMGCIVYQEPECYSNYMEEEIKKKFGANIIEKTWQKAKYMDSMGLGDRNAVFEGGDKKMYEFIYSNLNWSKIEVFESLSNSKGKQKNKVFVQIHIDTMGNVKVDSIHRANSLESKIEVKRVVEALPKWIPATRNGKKIEQKFHFALLFSEEMRKKYDTR